MGYIGYIPNEVHYYLQPLQDTENEVGFRGGLRHLSKVTCQPAFRERLTLETP
jgi:hypothetical protein